MVFFAWRFFEKCLNILFLEIKRDGYHSFKRGRDGLKKDQKSLSNSGKRGEKISSRDGLKRDKKSLSNSGKKRVEEISSRIHTNTAEAIK